MWGIWKFLFKATGFPYLNNQRRNLCIKSLTIFITTATTASTLRATTTVTTTATLTTTTTTTATTTTATTEVSPYLQIALGE